MPICAIRPTSPPPSWPRSTCREGARSGRWSSPRRPRAPTPDPPGAPMILVLPDLGLGGRLAAVPALRALRRQRPDERLVLVGPPSLGPLAEHATAVDVVVDRAGARSLPSPTLAVNL